MTEDGISLEEMAARTGVERRTLRSWIAEGLLAPPLRAGRGATYPEGNVTRALAVRRLKEAEGLQLAEIRRRLLSLDEAALRALAAGALPPAPPPPPGEVSSVRAYLAAVRGARPGVPPAAMARRVEKPAPRPEPGAAPAGPPAGLEALRAVLEATARANPSGRGRAEDWTRIPITPDLELHACGELAARDRATLERIAELIRALLTGGPAYDD